MLIIRPRPCGIIQRKADWVQKKVPESITSIRTCH